MPTITIAPIENITWQEIGIGNLQSIHFHPLSCPHVWRICISENLAMIADFLAMTPKNDHERALRYHFEKDRQRFIVSRVALRLILSKYIGLPPEAIKIQIDANKKPHLKSRLGGDIYFNVSHSGDMVLLAVSMVLVGVDIERLGTGFNYQETLPICFTGDEIAIIGQSSNPDLLFYTYWTRKEALVKATGKGIDDMHTLVPCINGQHTREESIIGTKLDWCVKSFEPFPGYLGSLALVDGCEMPLFFVLKG